MITDENNYFISALSTSLVYYERLKCSRLPLTHAVRWWLHCCTAHAWWYGLASLHHLLFSLHLFYGYALCNL